MRQVPVVVRRAAVALAVIPFAGCTEETPTEFQLTGPPVVRGNGVAATLDDDCELPPFANTSTVQTATDVPYRNNGAREQHLDYVIPAQRSAPVPAVIFIHGGGWTSGTTQQHGADMFRLASLGYASVSVGYRLTPSNRFPVQLADVRCAIRWIRTYGNALGIDTTRFVVAGTSAGAHLAELVALTAQDASFDGDCPLRGVGSAVSGVIAVAAPSDLRAGAPSSSVLAESKDRLIGSGAQATALAALASPITHVRAGAPRFLLVHGANDELVPIRQAHAMFDALTAANVPTTLVELPGIGHELPVTDAGPAFRPSTCTTLGFLREVFGR